MSYELFVYVGGLLLIYATIASVAAAVGYLLVRLVRKILPSLDLDLGPLDDLFTADDVYAIQTVSGDTAPTYSVEYGSSKSVPDEYTENAMSEIDDRVGPGTKILLDKICEGEGTSIADAVRYGYTSEYDITFSYGNYLQPSKPITTMTIREVYEFQLQQIRKTLGKISGTGEGMSAVGKYQITRCTLGGMVKRFGLNEDTLFDAATQDLCGLELLNRCGYQEYLAGRITAEKFQANLTSDWESIAMPGTRVSKYGQTAVTSSEKIQAAMEVAKRLQ